MKKLPRSIIIFFIVFLSMSYAALFSYIDVLTGVGFSDILDRSNYIFYAESPGDIFSSFYDKAVIAHFVNEPLFLLINGIFGYLTDKPELIVRALIFFSAFQASYLTFRSGGNVGACLVILLLPQIFVNYVMSLRQGVALAFFLTGWFSSNRYIRILFIGVTPAIHISFSVTLLFLGYKWFSEKITKNIYLILLIFVLICVFVNMTAFGIAAGLGVRQGESYSTLQSEDFKTSGVGAAYWALVLSLFFGQGTAFLRKYKFEVFCLIFYIVSYVLFPPFARTIQNHALLILISGFYLSGVRVYLYYSFVLVYFSYTMVNAFNHGFLRSFLA